MKKAIIILIITLYLIGLSACSKKANEMVTNYVGYWEILNDPDNPYNYSILKIYEENGEFYADINALSSKAPDGGTKVPIKLTVNDKDLNINSPFAKGSIVYYSDKNRIVVGNETSYNRVTEDQFLQAKQQKDQCKKHKNSYFEKSKSLSYGYEDRKKRAELAETFNKNINGLKGCRPLL